MRRRGYTYFDSIRIASSRLSDFVWLTGVLDPDLTTGNPIGCLSGTEVGVTAVFPCGTIFAMVRWPFSQLAKRHPYGTEWVEDLPERVAKDTVYIIGGKTYPFQAAVICPRRRCQQIIRLDIS